MIRFWIFQSNTVYVRKYIYWQVEYSVNRLVIVVGITLIWRKTVVTIRTYKCIIRSYETILALFKFGRWTKMSQIKIPAK